MRPQTLLLTVACTVTAVFMTVVGVVAVWQYLPEPDQRVQQQQPQMAIPFVQFNAPQVQIAPFQNFDLDFPIDPPPVANPIPAVELPKARVAVPTEKCTLSGPHAHGNLAIFLIHGEDAIKDQEILTLQEGLEQGKAVVHDRGVLSVDNRGNTPIFIQAGDIVKGGSQDRTLPFDMLVMPRSNNVPVTAFCVEAGRSGPRGNEMRSSFESSSEQLPTRKLRLAAFNQSQQGVWNNVAALQTNLARNVGGSVQNQQSATSLQLTLEHPRTQTAVQKYTGELGQIIDGKNDAIGYVVVINGKIQSADRYGSSSLFQKLWPKLLKASAVEALSERNGNADAAVPDADAVQAFLKAAEEGQASRVQANRGTIIRQETPQILLHDTCDASRGNVVLHRSYLAK